MFSNLNDREIVSNMIFIPKGIEKSYKLSYILQALTWSRDGWAQQLERIGQNIVYCFAIKYMNFYVKKKT